MRPASSIINASSAVSKAKKLSGMTSSRRRFTNTPNQPPVNKAKGTGFTDARNAPATRNPLGLVVGSIAAVAAAGAGYYYYTNKKDVVDLSLPFGFTSLEDLKKSSLGSLPSLSSTKTPPPAPAPAEPEIAHDVPAPSDVEEPVVEEPVEVESHVAPEDIVNTLPHYDSVDEETSSDFFEDCKPIEEIIASVEAEKAAKEEAAEAEKELALHSNHFDATDIPSYTGKIEEPSPSVVNPATNVDVALENALLASRTEVLSQITATLSQIENLTSTDVSDLDAYTLRQRVITLQNEARDRAKWEAVRLAEYLRQNDAIWSSKLAELTNATRHEATVAAQRQLDETIAQIKAAYEKDLQNAAAQLEKEKNDAILRNTEVIQKEARAAAAKLASHRSSKLIELTAIASSAEDALKSRESYDIAVAKYIRLQAALNSLKSLLEHGNSRSFTKEVAALQAAAGNDELVKYGIKLLPASVHTNAGVVSIASLYSRFSESAVAASKVAVTSSNASTSIDPSEDTSIVDEVADYAWNTFSTVIIIPLARAGTYVSDSAKNASERVESVLSTPLSGLKSVKSAVVETFGPYVPDVISDKYNSATSTLSDNIKVVSDAVDNVTSRTEGVVGAGKKALAVVDGAAKVSRVFRVAEEKLEKGDIMGAVQVLESQLDERTLNGMGSWIQDARERVQADLAMQLLDARVTAHAKSLF